MKIEVTQVANKGLVSVNLLHGQEEPLAWDVRAYDRTNQIESGVGVEGLDLERFGRIFIEINAYWASLPMQRQQQIFDIYKDIHQLLNTGFDSRAILDKLQIECRRLYVLMPLEEIKHWVLFHSDLKIPAEIPIDVSADHAPEQTYTRADYQDLQALAVAVRPMVPIWGEYIGRTKMEFGTSYKEVMAMKLLYYTPFGLCHPMERLRTYCEAWAEHGGQQGPSFAAILNWLGSSELPEWLLSMTIVRRIAVVPLGISPSGQIPNIIASAYTSINNNLRSQDRRFKGRVTEKTQPSASGEDPNNISAAEMYKVKQQVPDGDLITLNVYTERVMDMAYKVVPDIDPGMVETCLLHAKVLDNLPIQHHQETLAQWVMGLDALPASTIPLLNKPALIRTLAVTQAALWHWGFPDLAVLATAEPLSVGKDLVIGVMESRGRIPKDALDELIRLFPYQHHPRGKSQTPRQTNPASRAVDGFCELIVRCDWRLHAPQELINLSSATGNTKKLIIPPNIRAQLAQLIIRLQQPQGYSSV